MGILKFLCKIDSNSKLAGTIALVMMISIVVFCSMWLILKRLHLKKKYHADEQFVKEYKENLKKQEDAVEQDSAKPNMIKEDF